MERKKAKKKRRKPSKHRLFIYSVFLGNLFERFDKALYIFLSPFLAPLFFPHPDPIVSLILAYAIIPLGMLAKPIGSLVFGYIGDHYGREKALSLSLLGITIPSLLMIGIPTYASAGLFAPIMLSACRLTQNFFASGETVNGGLLVLENTSPHRKDTMSGLYGASTLMGFILASGCVSALSYFDLVEDKWRFLYLGSTLTAGIGLFLRHLGKQSEVPRNSNLSLSPTPFSNQLTVLWRWRLPLFRIICVSGFSYSCYIIALVLMNGLIPMVSSLTTSEVTQMNTWLIVLDLLLLPVFGALSQKCSRSHIMMSSALLGVLVGIPAFCLLQEASLHTAIAIRTLLVTIGVAFSAPFYSWAQEQVPKLHQCTVISMGSALGSQLLGAPTAVLSLWLFRQSGHIGIASIYWVALGALCLAVMGTTQESESENWS